MITSEQNRQMTQIGPGTPAGRLLRNYWQPVALVDELQDPRPVLPRTVLVPSLSAPLLSGYRKSPGHSILCRPRMLTSISPSWAWFPGATMPISTVPRFRS